MPKEKKNKVTEVETPLDEVGSTQEEMFLVSISSGYIFRNLISLLVTFSNSANLCFTKEGFRYNFCSSDEKYMVETDFPSEILNNYSFSSENEVINVGLDMENLFHHVKAIRVKDMIRLFLLPNNKADPDDKGRKIHIQIYMDEGTDINKAIYIKSKYVDIPKNRFPILDRKPDRVVSYSDFTKLGTMFKSIASPYIFITKKVYENETTLSFDASIENKTSGAICSYENPSYFLHDGEPISESHVKISKSILDKFSTGAKTDNGVVRIYVEDEKFAIFEISYTYLCYVKILIYHEKKKV